MKIYIIIKMFEKFFKNLIINVANTYIEDFTEQDIQIDNWNGVVVKEFCVVKASALQAIMRSLVGAPVNVKTGFVKKIKIDVPWSEIMSKPVEIYIEDIHAICESPAKFDKEFMRKTQHITKMEQFQQILQQFQKQQQEDQSQPDDQSESYLQRLTKIIKENLRINVQNVHIRFEDSQVSRMGKSFNFAVSIDQVIYSSTNNRFERVFLNIDDKKREKRSFSMLEIKQLAVYWNTNANGNWTENPEFVDLDCIQMIDFSQKYIDNLKRKYHQYKQNFTQNQVFLIQPFDFSIKFRNNLNQKDQPFVPLSTQNIDISQLLVTLDEEIYKDIQYLTKFFGWHSTAVSKEQYHYKFRPAFNVQVKGNEQEYWQYAIKSTLYYLRKAKTKQNGQLRKKRQQQMIEMSELYKLDTFNQFIKSNYSSSTQQDHFVLKVETESNVYSMSSLKELKKRIYRLECKLTAEQLVVAYTKGKADGDIMIEEEKKRAGWTTWLSSSVMSMFSNASGQGQEKTDAEKQEELKELEFMMKKLDEYEIQSSINSRQDEINQEKQNQFLSKHRTIIIPVIQLSLVNKSMNQYGSKQFMMIVVQDLFVQMLSADKDNLSKILWSIKNFEVVDRLMNQQKFARLIQKKDQISFDTRTQTSTIASRFNYQRFQTNFDDTLSEIEEEMNPNINNGMQQIQDFNRIKNSLEITQQYFMVMQIVKKTERRDQNTLVKCYNIDLMITNLLIFYNRVLLSRAQSFINQARINKVQNAQAEAEFDNKIAKIRQDTEERMSNMLEKSEMHLDCTLKSIELLAPDNINYELSKFLILQTGDIHLRSGESKRLNSFFIPNSYQEKQMKNHLMNMLDGDQTMFFELEDGKTDKQSFMIYDLKLLYIPTIDYLENYMYNDTIIQEVDLKHSILKKMDIIVEQHSQQSEVENEGKLRHFKIGVGNIDIQLTNKEIQQLKDFLDNIKKYHDQIDFEISRELRQIERFNLQEDTLEIKKQKTDKSVEIPNLEMIGVQKIAEEAIYKLSSIRSQKKKQNNLNDSFQSYQDDTEFNEFNQNENDDEFAEFLDARDYFDPDIIEQVEKIKNIDGQNDKKVAVQPQVPKKKTRMMLSLCLNKLKIQILEASNFEKEIVERTGLQFSSRQQHIDMRFKGIKFLELVLTKLNVRTCQNIHTQILGVYLKELNFLNLENWRKPQNILVSANNEWNQGDMRMSFDEQSSQRQRVKKKKIFDPEEEDQDENGSMPYEHQVEEQFDQLIQIVQQNSLDKKSVQIEINHTLIDLNENLIRKVYDLIFREMPVSQPFMYKKDSNHEAELISPMSSKIELRWAGIDAKISDKNDYIQIKMSNLHILNTKDIDEKVQNSISLGDFQVIQDDQDIFMKYHSFAFDQQNFLEIMDNSQFETKLLKYSLTKDSKSKFEEIILQDILLIIDFKKFHKIHQVLKSYQSQFVKISKSNKSDEQKPAIDSELSIKIFSSYVQLPPKEGRHQLFMLIEDFDINKKNDGQLSHLTMDSKLTQVFVSQSFVQSERYNLIQFDDLKARGLNGCMDIQLGEIKITLNENYIQLLSNIINDNFDLGAQLAAKLKKQKEQGNEIEQQQVSYVSEHYFEKLFDSENLSKLIILNQFDRDKQNAKVFQLELSNLKIEWVIGLNFEDSKEQFVTFKNRNQANEILKQLDKELEDRENQQQIFAQTTDIEQIDSSTNIQGLSSMSRIQSFAKKKDNENTMSTPNITQVKNQKITLLIKDFVFQQMKSYVENPFVARIFKVRQITLDSLNQKGKIFQIMHIHEEAVEVLIGIDSETTVGNLDCFICQQNAHALSNLTKSIYRCKNSVFMGRRKAFLAKVFKGDDQIIEDETGINKLTKFNLKKLRVIVYDSMHMEKDGPISKTNTQQLDDEFNDEAIDNIKDGSEGGDVEMEYDPIMEEQLKVFKDQFVQKVLSPDHIAAKSAFILSLSVNCVITRNAQWILSQYPKELYDKGLNKIYIFKVNGLEIYQNNFSTTLTELSQQYQTTQKLTILHPTNLLVKQVDYVQKEGYPLKSQLDTEISTCEIELTVKQVFKIKLLSSKIQEKLHPIKQILDHIKKRKSTKKEVIDLSEAKANNHKYTSLKLAQIYFTIIQEVGDTVDMSSQYVPMMSVESKAIVLRQQKNSDGSVDQLELNFPLEVYYFNKSLNFFEPFIEKTRIDFYKQKQIQSTISKLEIKELLNINFSVALYDCIFNFMSNLKQEQLLFEQISQASQKLEKKNEREDFSSSSYFIKNSTGEILMFKTPNQKAFQEILPDEEYPLDFQVLMENSVIHKFKSPEKKTRAVSMDKLSVSDEEQDQSFDSTNSTGELFDSSEQSDEQEDQEIIKDKEMKDFKLSYLPTRSIYRRRNYRFLKSEPKKVFFQIVVQHEGSDKERTSVFEVNIDSLATQRIFLDDKKEFYVICQTQQSDGKKHLLVRSPMQIVNNLNIPLMVILSNDKGQSSVEDLDKNEQDFGSQIINTEYTVVGQSIRYELQVNPGQNNVIPLRACGFKNVEIQPLQEIKKQSGILNRGDKQFERTQKAEISLLRDEQEIFEQHPVILESKLLRKNQSSQTNNNKIFMVLNANTYSIRSYVDFNTQQTEFISMRYLSISPPFVFQNLIPAPISLYLKNIVRTAHNLKSGKKQEFEDKQLYDLLVKHNSQMQILFLNPLGNFDLSLVIPGYEQTDFIRFKQTHDEDFKICEDIKLANYLKSIFADEEDLQQQPPSDSTFRFIKQKKMLFQLVSKFQNQFNICTNIAFIQGQYHITFYSKYWLLNNTLMPLEVQIKTKTYKFERMNLPYESQDFDFETIKKFGGTQGELNDGSTDKLGDKPKRKNSGASILTQTVIDEKKMTAAHSIISFNQDEMGEFVNYKQIIERGNNPAQYNRIKPWEGYKFQEEDQLGLLGLLTQQDIDSVQTVYFTQEEYKEEAKSESNQDNQILENITSSQRDFKAVQALKRSSVNLKAIDQQTMLSKTSIQMVNYQEQIDSQYAVPLVHPGLSNEELYSAPLQDKSQLKRVVLFSDNPQDEYEESQIQLQQRNQNLEQIQDKKNFIETLSQSFQEDIKSISLKICDSAWTDKPFDETKLQGESILLKDKPRKFKSNSMYEIVANVQYLPAPFNFSKIIEFKPRYMMINKTYQTIQIIQAECEEKGVFKAYPFETSVFHWTDSRKPQEINVKCQEHEFSGNIKIDGIGEMTLRLRGTYDNESIILSVAITEERNTLFIIFNDVSYMPPYRIENLTKTSFKIQQSGSRANDFDIIKPYQIIPYAWSYPLNDKLLTIWISSSSTDEELGKFKIDQISQNEKIILWDKRSERQFLLEILNEKTMKVIRVSYTDEFTKNELINNLQENDKVANTQIKKFQVILKQFGLSVINSQARELAYMTIKNLKYTQIQHLNNREFQLKIQDFQLDNQLVRKSDEIIIKRDTQQSQDALTNRELFLRLDVQYLKNDAIVNLYFFKQFYLMITPFSLSLNGNFCDEMFRYGSDIIQQTRKYHAQDKLKQMEFYQKDVNEIDRIKKAFDNLKKPYDQPGREIQAQKKVYFQEFYIHDIKLKFTFSSSPIMFREFSMNPTLKFLIVMLSNLKNVQLKFSSFSILQQQQLMGIFFAQLKRHYLQQCYNHKQILKLISSMGLFGNISESINSLTNAIESLVYHPLQDESFYKGLAIGGAIFVKESISAVTAPIYRIFDSFTSGLLFITKNGLRRSSPDDDEVDKNEFDDDIEQASQDFNNFGTPLKLIDTQNRIWLRILIKEKQSQDNKRLFLKNQQFKKQLSLPPAKEVDEQQIEEPPQHSLDYFSRRKDERGVVSQITYNAWNKLTSIPKNLINSSAQVIDNMNTRLIEEHKRHQLHKIRPPRFTSFTMELEPYSLKKAHALEVLNEINQNALQSESIQKLYNMNHFVIIITAKRIICVQEFRFGHNDEPIGNYQRIGDQAYKHWVIYFEDILKLKMDMVQNKKQINPVTGQIQFKKISKEDQQQYFADLKAFKDQILFSLTILFSQGTHQESVSQHENDSLFNDFRVSSQEINVQLKDFNQLQRVYKEVYQRSQQNLK